MISQPKTRSWKQSPKKRSQSCSITAPSAHTRVTIGDVVLIKSPSEGIGVIRYINQSTEMIGIELTDPIGTCNGNGYFQCRQKYGIFVIVHDIIRKVSPEELLHKVVVLNHVTRAKCQQLQNTTEENLSLQKDLQIYKETTNDLQLQIIHLKKILKSRETTDIEIAVDHDHLPLLNNHHQQHNSGRSRSYSHSSYHSHSHSRTSSHNNSQRSVHSGSGHRSSSGVHCSDRVHVKNEVSRVFSPEPEVEPIEYEIEDVDDVIRYEIDSEASPAYNPTVQQLSGFLKRIPRDQFPKLPNELIEQINDITQSPKFNNIQRKYRNNYIYHPDQQSQHRHSQRMLMVDENGIEISDTDYDYPEDDEKQYRIESSPHVPATLLSIDDSRTSDYISQHITHARVRTNGRKVRESLSNSRNDSPIVIDDDESISSANDASMLLHPREENGFLENDSKSVSPEMHSVVCLTDDDDDDMDMHLQIDVEHSHSNEHYFVQSGGSTHSFNSNDRNEIGRRLFTDHYKHLIDSAVDNEVMDASFLQRGKLNSAIKQYMNARNTHVQRMPSSHNSNVEEVAEILRKLKVKQDAQSVVKRKKPGFSSSGSGSAEFGSNSSSPRSNSKFLFHGGSGDGNGVPMSARDNGNVYARLSQRRVSQSQHGSPRSFQSFVFQISEETQKLVKKVLFV